MRVGVLGTRGIPNVYGGFEQFAQHLAVGLAKRNHEVFVYNSSDHPYRQKSWNGISIIVCKDWENKIGTAGQFIYDYNCLRDARRRNFDVLLQLGYTSNSIWYRLWPNDTINIVNMDGLEWKRSKYSRPTQRFLRLAERLAAEHAHFLVADSKGIQEYLRNTYHKESIFIPYGANIPQKQYSSLLNKWNLAPYNYNMLVARMEPENNIEMIIQGALTAANYIPLVVVGSISNRYGKWLAEKYKVEKIQFIGALYEAEALNSLRSYCRTYFHGHSVGGTNPSLLEAMACGCNIAAHENIFNRSVLGAEGSYFSSAEQVRTITEAPLDELILAQRKKINLEKIKNIYNWDRVVDEYEQLFFQCIKKSNA